MADVARAAEVSVATVSRVLNGYPHVAAQQRERVLAVIEALNYRPNRNAQNLRARKSTLVGVVVPDIANPYFMAMVRGCEDVAQQSGLAVIVASTEENAERERQQLESIVDHGVTHVVLAPATEEDEALDFLAVRGTHCVLVDRDVPGSPYGAVLNDDLEAVTALVEVLVQAGHRDIGVVAGPQSGFTGRVRLAAARDALIARGLDLPSERVVIEDFMDGFGHAGVLRLLQQRQRPTAVLVCNNILMGATLRAARLLHIAIPADLSLVGIAEREFLDLVQPPITTAQQDPRGIGRLAMKVLMDPVALDRERQVLRVPAPLVAGASVLPLVRM